MRATPEGILADYDEGLKVLKAPLAEALREAIALRKHFASAMEDALHEERAAKARIARLEEALRNISADCESININGSRNCEEFAKDVLTLARQALAEGKG